MTDGLIPVMIAEVGKHPSPYWSIDMPRIFAGLIAVLLVSVVLIALATEGNLSNLSNIF